MLRKLLSMALTIIMVMIMRTTAFAQESYSIENDKILRLPVCSAGERMRIPVGDAQFIDDGTGNLIKVSDLMGFETQKDVYTVR